MNAAGWYRRRGVLAVVAIGCVVVVGLLFIQALRAIADPGYLPVAPPPVSARTQPPEPAKAG